MTDEEMAEERATVFANINYNEPDNYGTEKEIGYHAYYCGFLAGLKAGRPQWHKVADGDLPGQDGNTCFSIEVLASNKKWVYYQFTNGKWFCGNKEVKVIDWCEIPTFDKE